MLDQETYREWTTAFGGTSSYEGGWATGDTIRFVGADEDGNDMGMIGFIDVSRPEEFVSIEYTGMVINGVDDFSSDAAKSVVGTHENYTFIEKGGRTTLNIDIDVDDDWEASFNETWPVALEKLKTISEQAAR